jgi:hypothetical protein
VENTLRYRKINFFTTSVLLLKKEEINLKKKRSFTLKDSEWNQENPIFPDEYRQGHICSAQFFLK